MGDPRAPGEEPGLDSPRAWAVVAAAFAALFCAFGIAYSYGAFLEELRAELSASRAAAAALFSITSLIWFGFGGVTGAAADRFGPRRVLLAGALALALGLAATARARSLPVALVTYGLGVGIGVACAYVPMVALVGAWFERRRTLALGVAVAGIGTGTLVVPPASAALIGAVGWREAFLVLAAAGGTALAACALAVRPAPGARHGPGVSVRGALGDPDYRWLYGAGLLMSAALYVPLVHLAPYAEDHGVAPVAAAALLGAIGVASVVGRLALGALAARVGLVRTYQGCFAVMAASFALWWAAGGSLALMVAFALVLGVGYGGYVALSPAVVAGRFGVERLGALLGVLYTGSGLGAAAGPPLAGAAIDAAGYRPAIAGSLAVAAAALAVLLPVAARAPAALAARPSPVRSERPAGRRG
jgi:MFS family permease